MSRSYKFSCSLLRPAVVCGTLLAGCTSSRETVPLREIYSESAQRIGNDRDPVVVIPGILGSRLIEPSTGQIVWGAFTYGAADADYPDGARLIALPMVEGVPLVDLHDSVRPDGVLESLEANLSVLKVTALEPYRGIIATLAAGRYVDRDIALAHAGPKPSYVGESGPIDYAGAHFSCFQFDYDWRRDISENASRLDALIRSAAEATKAQRLAEGNNRPVKIDVVAHSMGGLVLMYYLRYGTQPLPEDGSLPPLSWAGAERVGNAVLVGTPSGGSVLALKQLVEGVSYSPIVPEYRPAIIGTMPALYQLLPRVRHRRIVDAQTGQPIDFFNVETWEKYKWGLVNPEQDAYLQWLLPDVSDPARRWEAAIDHLRKCLARAQQLHQALDIPSPPPAGLSISLVLGDAEQTPSVLEVDARSGAVRVREFAPGDGTVTRASALMDERVGAEFSARLRTPIRWDHVQFIAADHISLTSQPAFIDGLLYELLESPR